MHFVLRDVLALAPMQLKLMRWLLRWAVFVITIHAGLIGHFSEASTDTSIHILQTDVPMEVSVDKGDFSARAWIIMHV